MASEICICVLLNVYDLPGMTAFGSHFESVMISKITSTVEAVGNSNVELLGQNEISIAMHMSFI